jgi:hypothetical protein
MAAKINTLTVKSNHQPLGSRGLKKLSWKLTRFCNNMKGQGWQLRVISCKRARGVTRRNQIIPVHRCMCRINTTSSELVTKVLLSLTRCGADSAPIEN